MSKNGGTCFDPLLYYFPADDNVYKEIEATFIYSGAIKVTPSLVDSDLKTVDSYFPDAKGPWVSLLNFGDMVNEAGYHPLDITVQST